MSKVVTDGTKEILLWKLISAVTCNVLSQVVFLILFSFLLNINLIHPLIWIGATFNTLTSLTTWLCLIPLGSIIFAQGIICSKDYIFETSYKPNRLMKFLGLFSLRNLLIILLHIMTGILIVWLYLNLIGTSDCSVYKQCKNNEYCLVEETFFMLMNGFWIGIFYFVKSYLSDEKDIQFPVIQQRKFVSIKITLKLKQAMSDAIWPTIYFLIIYYYRGSQFRDSFANTLHLSSEKAPLNIINILQSFLLIYCWLFSTLFIFTMLCMKLFFEVFLTEHWKFAITTDFEFVLTLKDALNMNNIPIIQHLACLDVYMLALWDPARRQQFFTLSQPGGHPHNWNNVSQEILKIISDFSMEINKVTDSILSPEIVKPKEININEDQLILQNSFYDVQPAVYNETIVGSPFRSPLRNLSLPRTEPMNIVNVRQNDFIGNIFDKMKCSITEKFRQIINNIKKKPGFQYFFGDLPESRIYFLLSKGQPVVWAIEGLSAIVTASFKEDKYGVVQKDLPVILTTLVNLKQNLDKLSKVTIVNRKSSQSEIFKMQLKVALRTAVKRSLYNISNVFGEYFGQLPISKEVAQQLNNFVLYKEG